MISWVVTEASVPHPGGCAPTGTCATLVLRVIRHLFSASAGLIRSRFLRSGPSGPTPGVRGSPPGLTQGQPAALRKLPARAAAACEAVLPVSSTATARLARYTTNQLRKECSPEQ